MPKIVFARTVSLSWRLGPTSKTPRLFIEPKTTTRGIGKKQDLAWAAWIGLLAVGSGLWDNVIPLSLASEVRTGGNAAALIAKVYIIALFWNENLTRAAPN